MAKILKNNTASPVSITDVGQTVPASSQLTIDPSDYDKYAQSNDAIIYIADSTLTVNDGSVDLSIASGVGLIQGSFISKDFVASLKSNDRLKVETQFNYDNVDTDDVSEGVTNLYFTNERAQDAIGAALTDTASVDFTYNDAGNTISAAVLPAGVDHNSLANLTTGDVHTQYFLLAGRSGGQSAFGGTASGNNLTLSSTSNATKGKILFGTSSYDEVNNYLGINTTSPMSALTLVSTNTSQIRGISNFQYSTDTVSGKIISGKARGTPASPTAALTSDVLGNYTFFGYGTTTFIQGAAIRALAQQTFTDSAAGTNIEIQTSPNSSTTMTTVATFQNDQQSVFSKNIRLGDNTSTSTNGDIRYATTNTEFLSRENGTWKNITITPTVASATGDTSTTSGTYSTISSMTHTPAAGTYMCYFTCTAALASDTTADISIFVNGTEDTTCTRRLSIDATGLGVTASFEVSVCIITEATVNGSQVIDVRFRENGGGTLTIGPRRFKIIPISR